MDNDNSHKFTQTGEVSHCLSIQIVADYLPVVTIFQYNMRFIRIIDGKIFLPLKFGYRL